MNQTADHYHGDQIDRPAQPPRELLVDCEAPPLTDFLIGSTGGMAEVLHSLTGYSVTCTSREALESFNKGVLAYVTLNGDCMLHFSKAIDLDPDFLLPHCVLVRIV